MPLATVASGTFGVQQALANNNIIVVVDILRFSSMVITAIANGFTIIQCLQKNIYEIMQEIKKNRIVRHTT